MIFAIWKIILHLLLIVVLNAKIFGASIYSSNKIAYSERLVGFISHQMNSTIKPSIKSELIKERQNYHDLSTVKSIVSTPTHADLNDQLPDWYTLIQEISSGFGTTFDVVQRFLRPADKLQKLLHQNREMPSTKSFQISS